MAKREARHISPSWPRRLHTLSTLQSLVLFPLDDTVSNLMRVNPADEDNIQQPASHGFINLGALFQIDEEGGE